MHCIEPAAAGGAAGGAAPTVYPAAGGSGPPGAGQGMVPAAGCGARVEGTNCGACPGAAAAVGNCMEPLTGAVAAPAVGSCTRPKCPEQLATDGGSVATLEYWEPWAAGGGTPVGNCTAGAAVGGAPGARHGGARSVWGATPFGGGICCTEPMSIGPAGGAAPF